MIYLFIFVGLICGYVIHKFGVPYFIACVEVVFNFFKTIYSFLVEKVKSMIDQISKIRKD